MIVFLKRHWISISLLIVASIVGFVQYQRETPIDIWLIEYEFETSVQNELPVFTQSDTVFQYENIFCRNYVASVGDTLVESGIRRFEMKLSFPPTSENEVKQKSQEILASPHIRIVQNQFRESQKNRHKLLYWMLFGLFLGMLVEFLISLKKKPGTN